MRSSEIHFEQISVEQAKKIAQEELSNRHTAEGGEVVVLSPQPRGSRHFACRSLLFSRRHHMNDSLSLAVQTLKEHVLRERDPETLRELVAQIDSLLDVIEARVRDLTESEGSS